ncbi:MAG: cation:proton antiporter [Chitinophagaceae bacterium]
MEPLHLPHLITDLGLILGAAAIVTILFKWLKQPLVLGYLIAGFLVGPHFSVFPTIAEAGNIQVWAEIGVIFLLFSLGLEFSFKKLLKVGASASVTAIVEVAGMLMIGYITGRLMHWSTMDSIFLGGVLSISSTTIIIRAFEEQGVKGHKFAGLVFGILIVEDLVAIVLLVLLSTLAVSKQFAGMEMIMSVAKLILFLVLWFFAGIFFLPTLLRRARKFMNDEMLLITSLALCIMMVWLATAVGFSPALGAFIMGSILAETIYAEKIEHLVKGVKDLFGAVFFVSVGMLFDPKMMAVHWVPVLVITLVTLFGKALSTTLGALVSGQPLKTSIQSGMSLSQIGEFSFIIATLGVTLKVTSDFLYPIAVAVSAITTFTTPYMIRAADPLYKKITKILPIHWQEGINRYSNKLQNSSHSTEWQQYVNSYFINTILLTAITAAIVLLSSGYLLPFIRTRMDNDSVTTIISAVVTMLLMAPFLWALAIRQHQRDKIQEFWKQNKSKGLLALFVIFRILLAVFLVGFLLDRFFSPRVATIVSIIIVIVLIAFSRKIQQFYFHIQQRFLDNYNEREKKQNEADALAPWDAHLATFEIQPDWEKIGIPLLELAWRERYGVNVAMIERGNRTINTPTRNEQLFPHDIISVIGTDEQIDQFRKELDIAPNDGKEKKKAEVTLDHFVVHLDSELVNKSIRASNIRERVRGIVVGVESAGNRIINPESNYIIRPGDTLWIVGDKLRLLSIKKAEETIQKS